MNKQELINKLQKLLTTPSEIEGYDFDYGHDFGIERAILLAEDLDEPVRPPELEKPVVPQFVADWYEDNKDDFEYSVQCLCVHGCEPVRQIDTWFDSDDNKPIETLVKMNLYGYEVEKEKLYTVELPIPNGPLGFHYVFRKNKEGEIVIGSFYNKHWRNFDYCQLTEAEIKKDHDWAWKYAEEVEDD